MVISKEEVDQAKRNSFREALDKVESNIDQTLKAGGRIIHTKTITDLVLYHKNEFVDYVISEYKLKGWNVKQNSGYDNTQWDYLRFM